MEDRYEILRSMYLDGADLQSFLNEICWSSDKRCTHKDKAGQCFGYCPSCLLDWLFQEDMDVLG